ncbi:retrovirus-related pol polyprotein from transposon TNT 1-94 [Tanacetum coccineum]
MQGDKTGIKRLMHKMEMMTAIRLFNVFYELSQLRESQMFNVITAMKKAIMPMIVRNQNHVDGNAKTVPSYDAKAVSEVNASSKVHEQVSHVKCKTIIQTSDDDQIDSNIIFDDPYLKNNGGTSKHDSNAHDEYHEIQMLAYNVQREAENQKRLNNELKKQKELLQKELETSKKDFKDRENRYLKDIVDLEEKLSSHDRIVYKIGQSIQTIHMLEKKLNKVYDPFLKAGLGYKNPECLKKAIAAQPKMYDGEMLHCAKLKIDSPDSEKTLEDASPKENILQNEIDRLFEVSLTSEIHDCVLISVEKQKNELLNDELEKSSSDSKDIQANLFKRIKILENDFKQSQAQSIDFELKLQHQKDKMACDVSWKSKLSTINEENVLLKTRVDYVVKERESVESSNSIRRPKSKDIKSKDRVLKNNNDKRPSAHVQKMSSSVSIDSNKRETMHSNVIQLVLWIVDSGCSKHMIGNLQLLRNFVETFMGIVRFRNDHFAAITGDEDYGDDLLTGFRNSNLYTISISEMAASSPVCLMSKATSTKSWLWHRRLSHLNFGNINQLTSKDLVDGLSKFKYNKDHFCSACEQGKSKKASLPPKLVPSIESKLKLLHIDLCGPIRAASINGKKYILVIVDDYSRNQKAQILTIRTDNETEFKSEILRAFYAKLGIVYKTSIARTPQQNGVVERRNRTLVEVARTMLIFSKTLKFMWAEAIATACFSQNHSIVHTRHNKTPYELIRGRKPNVQYFHVFGSLCYLTSDRDDLGKIKPKADIGIFIGYSESSREFHIYNHRTKKIMEMIHVKFDELTPMASECNNLEPGINSTNFQDSSKDSQSVPSKTDLDNLFGPLYEEYYATSLPEVSDNFAANTLDNENTSSSSSIVIEEDEAP